MKKSLLIVMAAVALSACGSKQDTPAPALDTDLVTSPATATGEEIENPPVMTFEKEAHDFGTIIQGEKVSYAFKFTNTGNSDLLITNAMGSCGCTVPNYPKNPIKPGDSGVIDVVFDSSGKQGQQNKRVSITANTVPSTVVISINGTVEVPETK